MQKLQEKQLLQLKQKEQKTKFLYRHALDALLHNETLKILVQFCKEQLKNVNVSQIQNINDYSPVSISRLIFSKQLKSIKQELEKLPNNHKCPIDHFLLIMLKIVKFPFQKAPLYLLGLKQMFRQIKSQQEAEFISYEQIQNYVMGQVVNLKDQTQIDTQFEIQFAQNKMQDFLMHDNGVNKIHFSNDLKKYIVLDQNSNIIKIYDQKMKIVAKFEPNKQKHNKKHPLILTFDYNELGSKLALSLSDNTLSIVNLGNFLQEPSQQIFRSVFLNEVIYKAQNPITKIYFLSMMNKWLCIDQANEAWVYDVQKFKQQNENYKKKFKHPNDDYQIKSVIEIVSLAAVAFVINNEVWFYNQTLNKKKFKKFSHCQQIKKFTYSQERNQFYLIGKQQKCVTIFNLNKINGEANKIWTFSVSHVIRDFEIFPFYNTILILDVYNNLKIYSQQNSLLQYQQNYHFIVKKNDITIKLLKFSKNQFLIHATYVLVMELKKVAIQRDMQFSFLDIFFYDQTKQQLVFSVNGQVMGLSLMHGEIRKNLATQNSNLDKHKAFFTGKNTQLFVIDQNDSLYQIYLKNDQKYKQHKDHRKSVGITGTKKSFYDQQYRMIVMISESSIYLVRNDSQNNFTFKSCLILQSFPQFSKYKYYTKTKELLLLDSSNLIYLMNTSNYSIKALIKLDIFKEQTEGQKMIADIQYDEQLQILMVLTNNGEFALFNLRDQEKHLYIKVKDILPYKLQSLTFQSFCYQKQQTCFKNIFSSRIFFYNSTGFIIQFQTDSIFSHLVNREQFSQKVSKFTYIKDTHQLDYFKLLTNTQIQNISLKKLNIYKPRVPGEANFIKVHDRLIVYSRRIFIEGFQLLTIGQDGHVKLWGHNRNIFSDLKLPLMFKLHWNMNELHQKRNLRILTETKKVIDNLTDRIKRNQERQLLHFYDHKKRNKNKSQKIKIDFDNPIVIQFENKDLEEIVMNNRQFQIQNMTIDVDARQKKLSISKRFNLTQRITQPWKKRKQFQQIYQRASPVDKYVPKFKQKMPFDLLLMRNDLRVGQNIPITKPKDKVKEQKLIILPQLKNYLKNQQLESQNQHSQINPEQKNQSQSIYRIQEQNKFQSCLFVKSQRGPKKANAFDQIDKYFQRKEQELLNKRWIPNKRNLRKNNHTLEPKSQNSSFSHSKTLEASKLDPLKSVLQIFEDHNKEAIHYKKGRLINIPNIGNVNKKYRQKKTSN